MVPPAGAAVHLERVQIPRHGPVSVVLLVRARTAERRDRRLLTRSPVPTA